MIFNDSSNYKPGYIYTSIHVYCNNTETCSIQVMS